MTRAAATATRPEWRRPAWYTSNWDPAQVTPEQLDAWRRETEECEEHNRTVYAELREKYTTLLALAKEVYGHRPPGNESTIVRAIRRAGSPPPPSFNFNDVWRRVEQAAQAKAAAERAKEQERERAERQQAAVLWLMERGKKLGDDFALADAITVADAMAFDQEAERRCAEPGLHSFSGEDMCEDCGGWDGTSRRCECGNRRVDWVQGYSHSFQRPDVYAEAY